jgi:hypothetical protein
MRHRLRKILYCLLLSLLFDFSLLACVDPFNPEAVAPGWFTAVATSVRSVFIERIFVEEEQLEPIIIGQPGGDEPPPPTLFAPCMESSSEHRSSLPNGWIKKPDNQPMNPIPE